MTEEPSHNIHGVCGGVFMQVESFSKIGLYLKTLDVKKECSMYTTCSSRHLVVILYSSVSNVNTSVSLDCETALLRPLNET